jgi:hypothetical protein
MKELFLSLQRRKEIPFGNGVESVIIQRRQEQAAYSQASQTAAGKQQRALHSPKGKLKDCINL